MEKDASTVQQMEEIYVHIEEATSHKDKGTSAAELSSCHASCSESPSLDNATPCASNVKNATLNRLKLLVCSWNVGNAQPPKVRSKLQQWIPEGGGDFDVIAVGLQESSYREKHGDEKEDQEARDTEDTTKADDSDDEEVECSTINEDVGDEEHEEEDYEDVPLPTDEAEEEESKTSDVVIVKRSRSKKSMLKVSKIVKQMSSNIRETVATVADVLEYPFLKQLVQHVGDNYALVARVELMEMRLFVFALARHNVTQVEKLSVPTGLGSVIGNKGGLLAKFVIANTSLCFVSCHLAAHQDQKFLERRNADSANILSAQFGMKNVTIDHQFDHCFWFGDMNYRVDLNYLPPTLERTHGQHFDEVSTLVNEENWEKLNANDQLRHQILTHKAFSDWELPPALFRPTFKRVRHTPDQFNPQRVPSYCDRVLHKSLEGHRSRLKLLQFNCVDEIATSDHKPVFASFEITPTPEIRVEPALLPSEHNTVVEITDLSANDLLGMDVSGLSDPYVKFYSVPSAAIQVESSGAHPSTKKIMNNLSPKWKDSQVPRLHILCQEEDVKHVHLILMFMDYDKTSKDDVLGMVSLSLAPFCQSSKPKFIPFDLPITYNGTAAGRVRGKLRLTLPSQSQSNDGSRRASAIVINSGPMVTCSQCSVS